MHVDEPEDDSGEEIGHQAINPQAEVEKTDPIGKFLANRAYNSGNHNSKDGRIGDDVDDARLVVTRAAAEEKDDQVPKDRGDDENDTHAAANQVILPL